MYVCMYVCMYLRTYVRMYVCMYVFMCVCVYLRASVCSSMPRCSKFLNPKPQNRNIPPIKPKAWRTPKKSKPQKA